MTTGRRRAEQALRDPLERAGWRPRAAGWFTHPISRTHLAVVALSAAVEHSAPGAAQVTLHVGLRDESVEPVVAELCGTRNDGYRDRTVSTSIGYLMPEQRWHEWLVDEDTADAAAEDMSGAVTAYVEPYLRSLAHDPRAMIAAAKRSPAYIQATGKCRVVVLLAQHEGHERAATYLRSLAAELSDRDDEAALAERRMIEAARHWVDRAPASPS